MISVDGLTVEFGGTTLFKDVSFVINPGDRIALMGKNGAGKSTLLKILAGVRPPSRGSVSAPKDCTVCYLPQHMMTNDNVTVFQEASKAFSHLHEMEARINNLNHELETRTDYESDSYMAIIEEVATLSEKFYAIDMTHFEEDVEKALRGLASSVRILTVRPRNFQEAGACASSWQNCCFRNLTSCCLTNQRTILTLNQSDGLKNSSSTVQWL